MTLKIGDFVFQDRRIAEIERKNEGFTFNEYQGVAIHPGFVRTEWFISSDARLITINDLKYIQKEIERKSYCDEEVKKFLKRLAVWCVVNLT